MKCWLLVLLYFIEATFYVAIRPDLLIYFKFAVFWSRPCFDSYALLSLRHYVVGLSVCLFVCPSALIKMYLWLYLLLQIIVVGNFGKLRVPPKSTLFKVINSLLMRCSKILLLRRVYNSHVSQRNCSQHLIFTSLSANHSTASINVKSLVWV